MPNSRKRRLASFCSISLYLLLLSCSDHDPNAFDTLGVSPGTSSEFRIGTPRQITSACEPNRLNLDLIVRINNTRITMSESDIGDWRGSYVVEEGGTINIQLEWLHNNDIKLATLDRIVFDVTSDQTITFAAQDYLTPDDDVDGYSNLIELCANPASEPNNPASVPVDELVQSDPVVAEVNPSSLQMVANVSMVAETSFQIRNNGGGDMPLEFSVISDGAFPTFSPETGSLAAGQQLSIVASAQCGQTSGTSTSTVTVQSNGGDISLPVELTCTPATQPQLGNVAPAELTLSAPINGSVDETLSISNIGSDDLEFTATPDQTWLIVNPGSGVVLPGQSQTLSISATCREQSGQLDGKITIDAGIAGSTEVALTLNCVDNSPPMAVLSDLTPVQLNFEIPQLGSKTATFSFMNSGNAPLDFTVDDDIYAVTPNQGTVMPGDTQTLSLTTECDSDVSVSIGVFSIMGNFGEPVSYTVVVSCRIIPDVFFAEGQYNRALQAIYEVINNESFSTAEETFNVLNRAVVGDEVDNGLLTEISRGEQTLTNDGLPRYNVAYECVGGGNIDAIRLGNRYQADLTDCSIAGNFISGGIRDAGLVDTRNFFTARFEGFSTTLANGANEQTLSASMLLGDIDGATQTVQYDDINFSQSGDGPTYTVSSGKTEATYSSGSYSTAFNFDITGSFTNDELLKVKSDLNNTLSALENDYYITGSFLIEETEETGVVNVDANSGDINTFKVTISKDNATGSKPENWSLTNSYFLRCGILQPILVNDGLVCRSVGD